MKNILMAAVLVFVAAGAQAQTVVATLELDELGWGVVATPVSIDTDGSPYTQEWLVYRLADRKYRVVAERDGRMCVGAWFTVGSPNFFPPTTADVQRVGLVDVLISNQAGRSVRVIRLDTPECE